MPGAPDDAAAKRSPDLTWRARPGIVAPLDEHDVNSSDTAERTSALP